MRFEKNQIGHRIPHYRVGSDTEIDGFECREIEGLGKYLIAKNGQVYSHYRGTKRLKGSVSDTGYFWSIFIADDGTRHSFHFSLLVCSAFHGNRIGKQVVRHIDGNSQNDAAVNLQWGSHSQNMQDAWRHGVVSKGEERWNAKLSQFDVRFIKANEYGLTGREMAKLFCVGESQISMIRSGKKWSWVTV